MDYVTFLKTIEPHVDADYWVEIVFNQPVEIVAGRRRRKHTDRLPCRLFRGKKTRDIYYIVRARSSHGYALHYLPCEQVESINVLPSDWQGRKANGLPVNRDIDRIKRAARLAGQIFPGAWTELRDKLLTDPLHELPDNPRLRTYAITRYLSDREQAQLQAAFESKTVWEWYRSARGQRGRDLSIRTKLCNDGVLRAWYSSEYPGCGNGDYYLLINPTTAVFCEKD